MRDFFSRQGGHGAARSVSALRDLSESNHRGGSGPFFMPNPASLIYNTSPSTGYIHLSHLDFCTKLLMLRHELHNSQPDANASALRAYL